MDIRFCAGKIISKMQAAILAALLLFLCSYASVEAEIFDGTQNSVAQGETLEFDGIAPFNNIGNDINDPETLTGTILISGQIDSYQKIFGENLTIGSGGSIGVDLTQGASSVLYMASKTVANDGIFTITGDGSSLSGGISDISFTGAGQIILNDAALNLVNTAMIEQSSLTITAGKLTSNADLLNIGAITNNDTLTLTGGTFNGNVNDESNLNGKIIIDGDVNNQGRIFGDSLEVTLSGKISVDLTAGASSVVYMSSKTVANDGVFTITGDGSSLPSSAGGFTNEVSFTGTGELVINDSNFDVINAASITQGKLTITAGKLTLNFDDLHAGMLTNNGFLKMSGGNINQILYGSGNLIIEALQTNIDADVFNSVNLSSSAQINVQNARLNGSVAADAGGNTINFSGQSGINADMTGFGPGNTVNLNDGVLKLGENAVFFSGAQFNMHSGTTLDMTNGKTDSIALSDFNLPDSGAAFVNIDVDLKNAKSDNFIGTTLNNNAGALTIKKVFLISDVSDLTQSVNVQLADNAAMKNALSLDGSQNKVTGPIFTYDVSYDNGSGVLTFGYVGDYNPGIFIAPITMLLGGYLGQLNSYEQIFSGLYTSEYEFGKKGLWARPYGYGEKVSLGNGLSVSNTAYGAYFGYDTDASDIGREYDLSFSLYGAYNGSHQEYKEDNNINQDGGLLGFTAALRKKRFFSAFTANAGVISEHGAGGGNKEDFMMFTSGFALRTGYDFIVREEKRLRIQPLLTLSYSSVNMTPYSDNNGVNIDVKDLNPVQLNPSVKFISELPKDWQAYANIGAVWSFMSDAKSYADSVRLPDFSLKPYVQYGVGAYKSFGGVFSAGGEVYGRTLGRTGMGGQLNLNWKL